MKETIWSDCKNFCKCFCHCDGVFRGQSQRVVFTAFLKYYIINAFHI